MTTLPPSLGLLWVQWRALMLALALALALEPWLVPMGLVAPVWVVVIRAWRRQMARPLQHLLAGVGAPHHYRSPRHLRARRLLTPLCTGASPSRTPCMCFITVVLWRVPFTDTIP